MNFSNRIGIIILVWFESSGFQKLPLSKGLQSVGGKLKPERYKKLKKAGKKEMYLREKKSSRRLLLAADGAGTTVSAFCRAEKEKRLPAKVAGVITCNTRAGVVSVAKRWGIPRSVVEYKKNQIESWDRQFLKTAEKYDPDLILLAGFLKKIGPLTLACFKNKIINSHPALLPEFSGKGMYGARVHSAVIAGGKTETGVTIHLVNENYDEGRILAQERLPVFPGETSAELEKRVKVLEKALYIQTVSKILQGNIPLTK